MIKVDCSELRGETKLAVAEAISEGFNGTGVALLDGNYIAIDTLSGPDIGTDRVQSILRSYISGRKDASAYRVESDHKHIVIRSSVPVSAQEKRVENRLPPGLFVSCLRVRHDVRGWISRPPENPRPDPWHQLEILRVPRSPSR
jgi:hypothetical protein